MGIYSNGDVYGISFFLNNTIIFERKYDEKLLLNQIPFCAKFKLRLNLKQNARVKCF